MLGAIPVKTFSTRVAHKNFRELGGKPLWQWTYEAACEASCVHPWLLVEEYSPIIRQEDIWHPRGPLWIRPPGLSGDVPATEVVRAFLGTLPDGEFDEVCMLLPTSPFRTAAQIDECYRAWKDWNRYPSIISVVPLRHEKYKSDNSTGGLAPSNAMFESNGAIQMAHTTTFVDRGFHGIFSEKYIMDPVSGLDIDTEGDWTMAEQFFSRGDFFHEGRTSDEGMVGGSSEGQPRSGVGGDPGVVEVHGGDGPWRGGHAG